MSAEENKELARRFECPVIIRRPRVLPIAILRHA